MNVVPIPVAHYCGECCAYYAGTMETTENLAEDAVAGTSKDSLEFYTVYFCGDPRGSCELVDGDFHYVQNAWQCGECEEVFAEMPDAMDCCSE